jgi:hypothetical protein
LKEEKEMNVPPWARPHVDKKFEDWVKWDVKCPEDDTELCTSDIYHSPAANWLWDRIRQTQQLQLTVPSGYSQQWRETLLVR